MKPIAHAAFLAAALVASSAARADDNVTETRAVAANPARIHLGGVIELHVRQGATPSFVLSGDRELVKKVTVTQKGEMLDIDMEKNNHIHFGHREQLRGDLTVPNLKEFISAGVGSSEVTGFSGDDIRVELEGAGTVKMTSHYRNLNLQLGGVGSLEVDAGDAQNVDVNLKGAGHIQLTGQAKSLRAHLGGVGGLDAQHLQADAVDVDLTGLGGADVYAKRSANMVLSGLGSATVYGNPATRSASKRGLGSITWK
ncbi:MAG: head GIN domain-containing protein [Telluria sp.]